MPSSHGLTSPAPQRTSPFSYVHIPGADALPWGFQCSSFIVFTPPPEPWPAADLRAAMLTADAYLDAALDTQIEGVDADVLHNLAVLRGIVAVTIARIERSAGEYSSKTVALH
jgi:hypothetical protein